MKVLIFLSLLVLSLESYARPGRISRKRHNDMVELLKRVETERRMGSSTTVINARTLDYLSRRTAAMGVTIPQFQKAIARHQAKEKSIEGIKKLFLLSSSTNRDYAERKSAEKILSYIVKLEKAEGNFHLKPDVLANAVTDWSPREVKELANLLRQTLERIDNEGNIIADQAFMELLTTQNLEAYKKACK